MTHDEIITTLTDYLCETNPVAKQHMPLPLEQSLVELGIMDSFGVIELVTFIEKRWSLEISDSDLTREKFGGLNKMATYIESRIQPK